MFVDGGGGEGDGEGVVPVTMASVGDYFPFWMICHASVCHALDYQMLNFKLNLFLLFI